LQLALFSLDLLSLKLQSLGSAVTAQFSSSMVHVIPTCHGKPILKIGIILQEPLKGTLVPFGFILALDEDLALILSISSIDSFHLSIIRRHSVLPCWGIRPRGTVRRAIRFPESAITFSMTGEAVS